jgi:hypothetical protein
LRNHDTARKLLNKSSLPLANKTNYYDNDNNNNNVDNIKRFIDDLDEFDRAVINSKQRNQQLPPLKTPQTNLIG